jgi:hypothetical protein
MSVAAVADTFDRAVGSAGVLVQAVLDGVPAKRFSGQLLSRGVDLTGPALVKEGTAVRVRRRPASLDRVSVLEARFLTPPGEALVGG